MHLKMTFELLDDDKADDDGHLELQEFPDEEAE